MTVNMFIAKATG